jgi:hypothetical protein
MKGVRIPVPRIPRWAARLGLAWSLPGASELVGPGEGRSPRPRRRCCRWRALRGIAGGADDEAHLPLDAALLRVVLRARAGDHCPQAVKRRLSRLTPDALKNAADAPISITVHGSTATSSLGKPHGARLTLVKLGAN